MIYPNEVYFDDTGANKEPVFMWCGYLANMHYWSQFAQKWCAVLSEPPELPYWHQASARSDNPPPPFSSLSSTQLLDKEAKLADLAGWRDPSGGQGCVAIVARLPRVYYEKFVRGKIIFGKELTSKERKRLGVPVLEREHAIVFEYATLAALKILEQWGHPGPMNFIYDERKDDPYQDAVRESFRLFRGALPPDKRYRLNKLTFASAKSGGNLPLQAADMLAWHLGKRSRRPASGDDPLWHVMDRKPINEIKIGINELQKYVQRWNSSGPTLSIESHEPSR
jgi:hypothetical protein